jgi:hypothetical protein
VEDPSGTKTATVEFETKEDALYAQTKAAKPFDGQTIDVEFSTGNVLWVANYPPAADEKYIRSLFQSVSTLNPIRIALTAISMAKFFKSDSHLSNSTLLVDFATFNLYHL